MPCSRRTFIFYSPRDVSHSSGLQKVLESVHTCRQPLSQNSRMSQARLSAGAALPLRLLLRLGLDDACCECSADASADFMLSCTTLHGMHAHLQRTFPKPSSCVPAAWTTPAASAPQMPLPNSRCHALPCTATMHTFKEYFLSHHHAACQLGRRLLRVLHRCLCQMHPM